jgi:hypothetical protein
MRQFAAPADEPTQGELDVMSRNVLSGTRDLYLLRSPSRTRLFGKAEKLGRESWMIAALAAGGAILAWEADEGISVAALK